MRISDWSSDVCSSDLMTRAGDVRLASELGVDAIGFVFAGDGPRRVHAQQARLMRNALAPLVDVVALFMDNRVDEVREEIGRASCRERVGQYVSISVVHGSCTTNKPDDVQDNTP